MTLEKNTCDKCKHTHNSIDLIWITAEDFQPKEGEHITPQMYNQYAALCESCYLEMANTTYASHPTRQKAISIMENVHELEKLNGERWYEVEDIITNLLAQ